MHSKKVRNEISHCECIFSPFLSECQPFLKTQSLYPTALKNKHKRSTRLAVGKDGGVVALEAALDQLRSAVGVDAVLLRVHVEHIVVGEGLVFPQDHLGLRGCHEGADVTSLDLLSRQLGTDPGTGETQRAETCHLLMCNTRLQNGVFVPVLPHYVLLCTREGKCCVSRA